MHPFLVWLLCAQHKSESTARLAKFASKHKVLRDIPCDDMEQMLNLVAGWQSGYSLVHNICDDTANAWAEYALWLASAAKGRK